MRWRLKLHLDGGGRGVFSMVETIHLLILIEYITIPTAGDATDFGNQPHQHRVVYCCRQFNSWFNWWWSTPYGQKVIIQDFIRICINR